MLIAANGFGTGEVLWSIFWFFLFILFFWLLIRIFSDIFRAKDLSGWGKALWTIGIIVLPFLGILLYLIVNGDNMARRDQEDAEAANAAMQEYIRGAAGSGNQAEELAKLADLHAAGSLSDDEYTRAKAKVVG